MRRFVAKTLATLRDTVGQPFAPLKQFSIAGSPASQFLARDQNIRVTPPMRSSAVDLLVILNAAKRSRRISLKVDCVLDSESERCFDFAQHDSFPKLIRACENRRCFRRRSARSYRW